MTTPRSRPALTALALVRDAQSAIDLPPLARAALADANPKRREDAVMAADLAPMPALLPELRRALEREDNPGVRAMLELAVSQLRPRRAES